MEYFKVLIQNSIFNLKVRKENKDDPSDKKLLID